MFISLQLDLLRSRLEDKATILDKKGKQVLCLQAEKKRVDSELNEIREHMDIKERKIAVLQRKVRLLFFFYTIF